jgi:hypothetical protein
MAYFLFEALHRAGRDADAARLWDKAIELAPADQQDRLRGDRKRLLEAKPERKAG